jgi:hypothetical protein
VEETDIGGRVRIENESDAPGIGSDLFEQLEPFASNRVLKIGESRQVLTGTRQAHHEAATDRVADKRKYDRYRARFLLHDPRHLISTGYDHVGRHADQFSCKDASLVGIAASPTIVGLDIAPLDPAEVVKALAQRCDIGLRLQIALWVPHQRADPPQARALLCICRERPCKRAAQQRDEVAAVRLIELHSIPCQLGPNGSFTRLEAGSQPLREWFCNRRAADALHRVGSKQR